MESFLSCKTEECIQQERDVLHDRLEKGDPNAQFTYAFLYDLITYTNSLVKSLECILMKKILLNQCFI